MHKGSRQTSDQISAHREGFRLDVWCDALVEKQVLRQELASATDDGGRAALLLYELGRVALSEGHEIEAAKRLLRAFGQRPQFRPTLRLARHIYRDRGDAALEIKLLDAETRATQDHLTRAHLLRQHGRVLWAQLGDLPGAIAKLRESLELDPTALATVKLLDMLGAAADDQDVRREALRRQLEIVGDTQIRASLMGDMALVLRHEDDEAATAMLQGALGVGVGSSFIAVMYEELLAARGKTVDLVAFLEREAESQQKEPAWRAAILARAARLALSRNDDKGRAVSLLRASIGASAQVCTLADCYDLLLSAGNRLEAIEIGEQLFYQTETPSLRAALACELADYCRIDLGDLDQASDWYHRCLLHAPSYQPALEGLSGILEGVGNIDGLLGIHQLDLKSTQRPEQRAQGLFRVATLLERHGRDLQAMEMHRQALAARQGFLPSVLALERLLTRGARWDELIRLYDEQLRQEEDQERAIHLLETMASIWYHRVGDIDRAIECYHMLISACPSHVRALGIAAQLCAEASRWQELVDLREREIGLTIDGQRKTELLERTGEVWEYRLLDLDRAIDCYRRALEFNPEYLPALRALGRLYRQKGRWRELIAMHRAELQVCSDPEQTVSLLSTIAEVYEEELIEEQEAADTYREIVSRKPDYMPAIEALSRLLERRGQWRELVQLLDDTLDAQVDASSQGLALWRIAVIREEHLEDVEGAITDYRRALHLAPTLVPARHGLEWLLWQREDTEGLIEHLTTMLAQTGDAQEQAAVSRQLAELIEWSGGDLRRAVAMYERSLAAKPDLETLWAVARLYQQLDMPGGVAASLERICAEIGDDRMVGELELRLGQLKQSSGFGDPIAHYKRALGRGVGRAYARRQIERHARANGLRAELAESLLIRTDEGRDATELACVFTELAEIHAELGDEAAAERSYRGALHHDARHLPALWGLSRLLEHQQRWGECVDTLERTSAAMESVVQRSRVLLRAAVFAEERQGDSDRAMSLYRRVLRAKPGEGTAYMRSRALLLRAENWPVLASLIRTQITATEDQQRQAEMFAELGYLYLDRLGEKRKGEACLRRVVGIDDGNLDALRTLAELYSEREEWDKAEALYAQAVGAASGDAVRQQLLRRLARARLQLGHRRDALAAMKDAADLASGWTDAQLLRELAEAAQAAGDLTSQAEALERLGEATSSPQERIEAHRRASFIIQERLDDDERAIRALQRLLAMDPLDIEAVERLATVHGKRGNRSALAQHMQAALSHHRAAVAREPFQARLYRQMGRMFRWQQRFDALYCASTVLAYLGEASEAEQHFIEQHRQQCGTELTMPATRELFDGVVLPVAARGAMRAVLEAAQPTLLRLLTRTPKDLGLTRGDRQNKHPARAGVERMSALVGSPEFELWISKGDPEAIGAEIVSSKPALVIGAELAQRSFDGAERFRLGRALFDLSEPGLAVSGMAGRDLMALLAALARLAGVGAVGNVDAASNEQFEERLAKLMTRKLKHTLEALLPAALELASEEGAALYLRGLAEGANRVGLLLSADPLLALREFDRSVQGNRGMSLGDLCQFIVGDAYFTLRAKLGLSPGESLKKGTL